MRKYYRAIDSAPTIHENVDILLKLGGAHYSTMTSNEGSYRNFVMYLDDEELLVAKLSLSNVSIDPLSGETYEFLKNAGYIK